MALLYDGEKPFFLGAAVGAVLFVWLGFSALGWKTEGKSEMLGKQQAERAVVSAYAQLCSAQFKAAKDAEARLAVLQKSERWSRGDVVTKGGWATMYGAKEPMQGVAQACADLLIPEKN